MSNIVFLLFQNRICPPHIWLIIGGRPENFENAENKILNKKKFDNCYETTCNYQIDDVIIFCSITFL